MSRTVQNPYLHVMPEQGPLEPKDIKMLFCFLFQAQEHGACTSKFVVARPMQITEITLFYNLINDHFKIAEYPNCANKV